MFIKIGKLISVFEPHRYSRRLMALKNYFAKSFSNLI